MPLDIKEQSVNADKLQQILEFSDVFTYGLLYFVPMAPIAVFGVIYNASAGMVGLTYLLAAIAMVFSAISYSEMAKEIPLAGSVYSYVSNGINPFMGFISGWAILLDYLLLPALLAILGAIALKVLIPFIPKFIWILFFVVVPLVVNLLGIRVNAKLGKILLSIQLIVLGVFVFFAIVQIIAQGISKDQLIAPFYNENLFTPALAFSAVPIAALSFIGFDAVSTLNEEAKGGGKTVSKVTLLLLVTVTILFILQVYLAAIFIPIGTVFSQTEAETAFYIIATDIVGKWFLPILTLTGGIVAILANALVSQATTSKVIYSMARDGRLPSFLAYLNKNKSPSRSLLLVGVLSFLLAMIGSNRLGLMVTLVTFGALTAYIILNISVMVFFKKKKKIHFVKHLICPLLGILILSYALYNTDIHAKILGSIWLVIGLGLALVLHKNKRLKNITFSDL